MYYRPGGCRRRGRSRRVCSPLLASADLDLADAVRRLIEVEDELARLGGRFDPELFAAIEVVTRTFPGSKLVH